MPRLRRLSGKQLVAILESLGFVVVRVRGSHFHMQRIVEGQHQNLNVPVHGNKPVAPGTLKRIYRQARDYLSEEALKSHFYSD